MNEFNSELAYVNICAISQMSSDEGHYIIASWLIYDHVQQLITA